MHHDHQRCELHQRDHRDRHGLRRDAPGARGIAEFGEARREAHDDAGGDEVSGFASKLEDMLVSSYVQKLDASWSPNTKLTFTYSTTGRDCEGILKF